jgi:midasin (ATPase involved in ribosome maturation)
MNMPKRNHHVGIDRKQGVGRGDLAQDEDRDCSPEHDLPDLQVEPADLPDRDEQEDERQDDYREIRRRIFVRGRR